VEELQLEKFATEFGLRTLRESPPLPISLADNGISALAFWVGKKINVEISNISETRFEILLRSIAILKLTRLTLSMH